MLMKKFLLAVFCMASIALKGAEAPAESDPPIPQRTLSIVKPEAVEQQHIGQIINRFEAEGLRVVAAKMTRLSSLQAAAFYVEHKTRPFYQSLIRYMTSGPIFVQVLEGMAAVAKNREIMGATDPKKAAPGTLRARFGTDIERNAVHGSDSVASAKREIAFFFGEDEIFSK